MPLPAPFLAPRRPGLILSLLAIAVLSVAGAAHANYVWPVDGAPLCNASGDQHGLFLRSAGCNSMTVGWIHSVSGADSLATGTVDPQPPTGECSDPYGQRAESTGVTEVSATDLNGFIIALPGPYYCVVPPSAEVWLQGSGAAQQLVVHAPVWSHERTVVDEGDAVRHHPRMAPNVSGFQDTALAVVWSDERTGVPQIRAQRVTWNGLRLWGPSGVLVAPTGAAQTEPEISRLTDGSSLVVWRDARSGGSDIYATRLLANGSIAPGWPADGLALEDRPEISGAPRIVNLVTYEGYEFVVWDESGARFGGGRSIVALRLRLDGTPDPDWSPLGVELTSSPTVDRLQDVTGTDRDLVAVWTDTRAATPANPTDLYAQWFESIGVPESGWPASGQPICTATGRQDAARVSADHYHAAFAWEDRRGADADVYAELRLYNGTLPPGLWVADGLPATSAPGDQTAPVVGVGNSRGCFVAWEDARDASTTGLDIYAQAFSDEGEKLDVPPGGGPHALQLGPPRPNPMRTSAVFTLQSPRAGTMRVEVLDVAGRRVRTLAAGEFAAGVRELSFDGRDDAGRELPPGIYRVRARIGDAVSSRTLVRVH